MNLDPALVLTAQYLVALILLATGLHKAADRNRFTAVLAAYRVVPTPLEKPVMWLVLGAEITMGVALLFPVTRRPAAVAAAAVFAVYGALLVLRLARGHGGVDCGCSLSGATTPLSRAHIIRNGALVAVALVAAAPGFQRPMGPLDAFQIVAAVAALMLTYLSADALLAHGRSAVGHGE